MWSNWTCWICRIFSYLETVWFFPQRSWPHFNICLDFCLKIGCSLFFAISSHKMNSDEQMARKESTGSLSGSETETSSCYRLWIFLSCSLLKIDPPMFRLKKDATVIEKSYDAKPFLSLKIGRSLFQSEQKILKEVSMRILSKLIYLWSDRQIFEFPVNFRSNFRGKKYS